MSNLTVVIDEELLRTARIKALQQGTSVNEICRKAIERFAASGDDTQDFMAQLVALSDKMSGIEDPLPSWPSREAMYEEAMAERMPTLWATFKTPEKKPR